MTRPFDGVRCYGCGIAEHTEPGTRDEVNARAVARGWRDTPQGWRCPDCLAAEAVPAPASDEPWTEGDEWALAHAADGATITGMPGLARGALAEIARLRADLAACEKGRSSEHRYAVAQVQRLVTARDTLQAEVDRLRAIVHGGSR